jgi:hypothetical protein
VIVVESLDNVVLKGSLTEIPLLELPFVLRHTLCKRSKEAEVEDNVRRVSLHRLFDKPDNGSLRAVYLNAICTEHLRLFPDFRAIYLNVYRVISEEFLLIQDIS